MTSSNRRSKSASAKSSGSGRGNAGRRPSELGKPPSGRQVSVVIPRRPNVLWSARTTPTPTPTPTPIVDSRRTSTTTLNDSGAESHQSAETGATLTNDDIQYIDVEGDDDDELDIVSNKLVREPSPRSRPDEGDSVEEESVVEELISPEVLLRRTQSSSPDPLTYSTEALHNSGDILLDFVDVDDDAIMGGVSAHHMPGYYGNLEDILNNASDANMLAWPNDPPPPPQAPDRLFLRAPSSSPSKSASPTPDAAARSSTPPSPEPSSPSRSATPPPRPLQSLPSSPSKPRVHARRHSWSDLTEVVLDQYLEADYAGLWWTDETADFAPTVPIPPLPLTKPPTLTRHDGRSLTEQFVEIVHDWFGEEGTMELDSKSILVRPRDRGTPPASSEMLGKRKRSDSPARSESVASNDVGVKRNDTRSVSSVDLDLVRVFAEGIRPATDQDVNRVISLVARLKSLEGRVHKRFKGKTTNGAYYQVTIPKKLVRLASQHS